MDKATIAKMINDALVEEFELDPDEMRDDATLFDDLGLDSLDIVDMVIVLENSFSIRIREDPALREIRTLGDIHDFVAKKTSE